MTTNYILDVPLEGGKYRVVQNQYGELNVLRHDQPWRNITGLRPSVSRAIILAMAQEIRELRARLDEQTGAPS